MNPQFPLTESQERRLTITLTRLEQELAELRQAGARRPPALRLTEQEDPVVLNEALEAAIAQAGEEICRMAEELGLRPRREFIRQRHAARLQLALIELYETRPSKGMQGCGPMNSATAPYLETRLAALKRQVERVLNLLSAPPDA